MAERCLLVLDVPRALEDAVADWLLADDPDRGFASMRVRGHHPKAQGLSARELVTGHVERTRYEIECGRDEASAILERLAEPFGHSDLRYWQLAVSRHGRLRK